MLVHVDLLGCLAFCPPKMQALVLRAHVYFLYIYISCVCVFIKAYFEYLALCLKSRHSSSITQQWPARYLSGEPDVARGALQQNLPNDYKSSCWLLAYFDVCQKWGLRYVIARGPVFWGSHQIRLGQRWEAVWTGWTSRGLAWCLLANLIRD